MNALLKLGCLLVLSASALVTKAQYRERATNKNNQPNITIVTREFLSVDGRVIDITPDHILLNAASFNSPLTLTAYYIRPEGDNIRIDVAYIQSAIIRLRKKMGNSIALGAISGGVVGAGMMSLLSDDIAAIATLTATGAVAGSIVGTIKGLGKKKVTIPIHGSAENLLYLKKYF